MNVHERALLIPCAGESLVAVLACPEGAVQHGVVIIVGGPQVRTGSHRQFTVLARALAASGTAVLRFDVRGMGDSTGAPRDFRSISDDIGAAVDALCREVPGLAGVTLWGLCDGASAALLYVGDVGDRRVHRLALLNPWVRTQASAARTQFRHYYRQRLMQRAFWQKLFRGGVGWQALAGLWAGLRQLSAPPAPADGQGAQAPGSYRARMAAAWLAFDGPILLALSGRDDTAREFEDALNGDPAWAGAAVRANVSRVDLPGSDHTVADTAGAQQLLAATRAWLATPGTVGADRDTGARVNLQVDDAAEGQPIQRPAVAQRGLTQGLTVSVHDAVQALPQAAQALLAQTACRFGPEASADWFELQLHHIFRPPARGRLFVLWRGEHALAVLPMGVSADAARTVESLGNFYTSINPPALAADVQPADLAVLIRALRQVWPRASRLNFGPMDPKSLEFDLLCRALRRAGLVPFPYFRFGRWTLPSAGLDYARYFASRDGATRHTVLRRGRKFERLGGRLTIITRGDAVESGLAAYEQVYARSWKPAEPYPAFIRDLVRRCAAHGWLRLGVAWLGDTPVAAQIWIVAHGRAAIFKLAHDERHKALSAGSLLTCALMRQALDVDRVHEVDYLLGDDAYKRHWMSRRDERWGLVAFDPRTIHGAAGLLRQTLSRLWHGMTQRHRSRRA